MVRYGRNITCQCSSWQLTSIYVCDHQWYDSRKILEHFYIEFWRTEPIEIHTSITQWWNLVVATPNLLVLKSEDRCIIGRMCGRIDDKDGKTERDTKKIGKSGRQWREQKVGHMKSISLEFMTVSHHRIRSIDRNEIDQTQFRVEHSLGITSLFLLFSVMMFLY
jgi:hypothetical protein